jgi:adenylate cyclase
MVVHFCNGCIEVPLHCTAVGFFARIIEAAIQERGFAMSKEIERKFLLSSFPNDEINKLGMKRISQKKIYQTYLAYTEEQEIRVRQLVDNEGNSQYTHTFKSGHGLVREEIEYEISEDIYKKLLAHTGLVPLEKIRTTVEHQGFEYEIDEYKQVELTVVEVEFPDVEAAQGFTVPSWFGRELGQEDEFRNKTLWVKLQHPTTKL